MSQDNQNEEIKTKHSQDTLVQALQWLRSQQDAHAVIVYEIIDTQAAKIRALKKEKSPHTATVDRLGNLINAINTVRSVIEAKPCECDDIDDYACDRCQAKYSFEAAIETLTPQDSNLQTVSVTDETKNKNDLGDI